MKLSEGVLDLGTTDYTVALDPSYTMLEFDSLRVLPVETGIKHLYLHFLHLFMVTYSTGKELWTIETIWLLV